MNEGSTVPDQLLHELRQEQQRRWQDGVPLTLDECLQRDARLREDAEAQIILILSEAMLRSPAEPSKHLPEYQAQYPHLSERLSKQFQFHQVMFSQQGGLDRKPFEPIPLASIQLPGYVLERELGRGAMGVVYLAQQTALRRPVAIKMLYGTALEDELARRRFRSEGEILARLKHPCIVQIHEVGNWQDQPFLVLEFIDGGDLKSRMDGTPWQPRQAAQLVQQLAQAVHTAHGFGVIHRDLKPTNILLSASSGDVLQPKISDFGLAKLRLSARLMTEETMDKTMTGAILGTPSYMAPEQARGDTFEIGPTVDVYSLGAILYELLTGQPPFREKTPYETLVKLVAGQVKPAQILNPKVPRDLAIITAKCLEPEPARRYASAVVLADELQRFLENRPIEARPASNSERVVRWARRNPLVASLVTTLMLLIPSAIIALSVLYVQASRSAQRAREKSDFARRTVKAMITEISADLFQSQNTSQVRLTLAQRALQYQEAFLNEPDGDTPLQRYEVAKHVQLYAECLHTMNQNEKAIAEYDRCEQQLLQLIDLPELRDKVIGELGWLKVMQAELASTSSRIDYTEQCLRAAAGYYQRIPLGRAEREGEAYAWKALGQILARQPNKYAEAERAFERGKQLQQQLSRDYPEARPMALYGSFLVDIAISMYQMYPERSVEPILQDAIAALTKPFPNEQPQRVGMESLMNLWKLRARIAANAGDRPQALQHYDQAVEAAEALLRKFPSVPWYEKRLETMKAEREKYQREGRQESVASS